eukprot:gene22745-23997_t
MKTFTLALTAVAFTVAAAAPALADSNTRAQDAVQHAIAIGNYSANQNDSFVTEGRQAANVGPSSADQQLLNLAALFRAGRIRGGSAKEAECPAPATISGAALGQLELIIMKIITVSLTALALIAAAAAPALADSNSRAQDAVQHQVAIGNSSANQDGAYVTEGRQAANAGPSSTDQLLLKLATDKDHIEQIPPTRHSFEPAESAAASPKSPNVQERRPDQHIMKTFTLALTALAFTAAAAVPALADANSRAQDAVQHQVAI